jgi:glycosyltransferase involved in cell wall biosynthesis
MSSSSSTHLVLIPSYNAGARLASTVSEALAQWSPVWVVIDGSTDGSVAEVQALAARDPRVRVIVRERNGGKGAAVETGAAAALAAGFTHLLTMDSDGQHPAERIGEFMRASMAQPDALVLGRPVFGPEVPLVRLHGRKLSNGLARLELLGGGIDDALFGFRVYPAAPLLRAFRATRFARGFDFDPEIAVRMFWAGVPTINLPASCRYLPPEAGGVSHFRYLRDNTKMVCLHARLLFSLFTWRWAQVLRIRRAAAAMAREVALSTS